MDWYLPTHYDKEGNVIEPRPKGDEVSEERLRRYKHGQTGFPFIVSQPALPSSLAHL